MSPVARRSFSVVVCTLDRADSLVELFGALRALTHPRFEVIVVPGPCTDHTDEVLAQWEGRIKVVPNPEANLSAGRNLGIAAAAGEIVAFIDDDGIPEPTWLDELEAAYDDEEVAGAGGWCGTTPATRSSAASTPPTVWDVPTPGGEVPFDDFCFPGTERFPYLIGTNSSFRRDLLVEAGGFDEEFTFYLDETDVCLRLVDAGYVLRQLPAAEVLHKFMPSSRRNRDRVTFDLYEVVKSKVYFSLVHGLGERPADELLADDAEFCGLLRADLHEHADAGRITDDQLAFGLDRIEQAWPVGIDAGYRGRTRTLDPAACAHPPEFLAFPTIAAPDRRLHVAFVTQSLPPGDVGGIGRYMLDTARWLAGRGHEVRIITTGTDHDTVDLEHGVWVHRILKGRPQAPSSVHTDVPDRIWNNAGAVADEVERIHDRRPVDAVLAAMWDVEAAAVMERLDVPVVTTLVTTLGLTLPTKPEWRADAAFMAGFVEPVLALEQWAIEESDLVHAISEAVLHEAVAVAGAELDTGAAVVAPLGVPDHLGEPVPPPEGTAPTVLFVGRLEKRKGIDLLLDAVPGVLAGHPDARVVVVGRDDIPGESGRPPRQDFEEANAGEPWLERVEFRGTVPDGELWAAYRECSVFVAPSRFESFGLIYVEAMMAGRPVVALDLGAAREVVADGETGLLVGPDPGALAAAVGSLLDDPERAEAMGDAGRERYLARYTVEAMGAGAEAYLLALAAGGHGQRRPRMRAGRR